MRACSATLSRKHLPSTSISLFRLEATLEDLAILDGADFIHEGCYFDLILCSWTLFHLCDPLGTLLQLRGLLEPDGVLLANGVWFHVETPAGGPAGLETGSAGAMKQLLDRFFPMLVGDVVVLGMI